MTFIGDMVRAMCLFYLSIDKIYTNIAVGTNHLVHYQQSLNRMICQFQPTNNSPKHNGRRISYYRRSNDPSAKAMLGYALKQFNWSAMYAMQCCQAQVDYFCGVVNDLLDTFLPYIRVTKYYTTDKPMGY